MRCLKFVAVTCMSILVVACSSVPTEPIALGSDAIRGGGNRIAIQIDAAPKPSTVFPGANCLLCIGVAMAAHSDLTKHVETLQPDELASLAERLAGVLRAQGAEVSLVTTPVDVDELSRNGERGDDPAVTEKDFSPLAAKLDTDKLLVVHVHSLGVTRPYSAYVPVGEPKAFVMSTGYLVDLNKNQYLWFAPMNLSRAADGAWNEPPSFPGLTNAYYQVLAELTDDMAGQLNQGTAAAPALPVATSEGAAVGVPE